MAKPNALFKVSGSLLGNAEVIAWLKEKKEEFFPVIPVGGGEAINEAFKEMGWEIKFGPLGRITTTLEEKQLARDVLESNQEKLQDELHSHGIDAEVVLPIVNVGSVMCHVNGDVYALMCYNGFDKIFILTFLDNVEKKKTWLKKLAESFPRIDEDHGLEKIEIIGF